MSENGTVDLVIRDQERGNTLVAASTDASADHVLLFGRLILPFERGAQHFTEAPIVVASSIDERIEVEHKGSSLYFKGEDGEVVGPEIDSYDDEGSAIDGRYRVYSGQIRADDADTATVDVIAISDPVEVALAAILGGACLLRSLGELYLVKQVIDTYREQGHRPELSMQSSLTGTLTCSFTVEVRAVDPAGKVIDRETVKFGRAKKKKSR